MKIISFLNCCETVPLKCISEERKRLIFTHRWSDGCYSIWEHRAQSGCGSLRTGLPEKYVSKNSLHNDNYFPSAEKKCAYKHQVAAATSVPFSKWLRFCLVHIFHLSVTTTYSWPCQLLQLAGCTVGCYASHCWICSISVGSRHGCSLLYILAINQKLLGKKVVSRLHSVVQKYSKCEDVVILSQMSRQQN